MNFSMSALERIDECPSSAVLPHMQSDNRYSTVGTIIHNFLAAVAEYGRDRALEMAPADMRPALAMIDISKLPACRPSAYASEVSFAYDVVTGMARELGRGLDRQYDKAGLEWTEIPGTADVVGLGTNKVVVLDYKTGWGELTPAAENWQLKAYGLAAARTYGVDSATVGLIRVSEAREPWYDVAELSEADLDKTEDDIRRIMVRVDEAAQRLASGQPLTTKSGAHCRYCPAFGSCPGKARLAAALAKPEEWQSALPTLTLDNAPAVYERLQEARAVLDSVEDSLKLFASGLGGEGGDGGGGIPLGGGWVYGPKEKQVEHIDPHAAQPILARLFGEDVAAAALEVAVSITKTRLQSALQTYVARTPGVPLSKAVVAALSELRAQGAVEVTRTHPVMRHKPKAAKPEAADA